jgi:hypothetical protein
MSAPRRVEEEGGLRVSAAQSSGEWPGGRSTFREGRWEGGRVEVDAATGARLDAPLRGGARREEAADGGGLRELVLGGRRGSGRREEGFAVGGGMSVEGAARGEGLGGGIMRSGFDVWGEEAGCRCSVAKAGDGGSGTGCCSKPVASSRAKEGIAEPFCGRAFGVVEGDSSSFLPFDDCGALSAGGVSLALVLLFCVCLTCSCSCPFSVLAPSNCALTTNCRHLEGGNL